MTDAIQEQNPNLQKSKSDKEKIEVLIKSFPGCKPCDWAKKDADNGKWDPDDEFNLDVEKKDYTGDEEDKPKFAPTIIVESKCKITTVTGYQSPEEMRKLLQEVSCKTVNNIVMKRKEADKDG